MTRICVKSWRGIENLEPRPQHILFGNEGGQQATIKAPSSDVRLVLKPNE